MVTCASGAGLGLGEFSLVGVSAFREHSSERGAGGLQGQCGLYTNTQSGITVMGGVALGCAEVGVQPETPLLF